MTSSTFISELQRLKNYTEFDIHYNPTKDTFYAIHSSNWSREQHLVQNEQGMSADVFHSEMLYISDYALETASVTRDKTGLFITANSSLSNNGYNYTYSTGYGRLDTHKQYISTTEVKRKVCECGKEKHGFANHSDWCDLNERNTND